jgi:hypothetical protein
VSHLGLTILGLLSLALCWPLILRRWRLGLELYILFIPLAGAVELWLYPAPWAVLIKDVLFAIPAYIGFATSGELGPALSGLPRSVGTIVALFAGIVLVQVLNPGTSGLLPTLIGLKVWLFYLPMLLLGRAYVRDRASLVRLSRLMICLGWLPCTVGILQWLLSLKYGYQYAVGLFYGAAAGSATQGFSSFSNGLMRIPATFAFPAQYLNYVLFMFVPVLGCVALERERVWQKVRAATLALLCMAGFMTGARAAFVMIPVMLFAFYILQRGTLGVIWAGVLMSVLLIVMLFITQVDPAGLLHMETRLTRDYTTSQRQVFGDALRLTWIGRGVGINTGAEHVAAEESGELPAFESYYAKAIAELGLAGFLLVVSFQVGLLLWAVRIYAYGANSPVAPYAAAIAAGLLLFLIYNFKGFVLDLDPANMLYWLFAGVLFSLPSVGASIQGATPRTRVQAAALAGSR